MATNHKTRAVRDDNPTIAQGVQDVRTAAKRMATDGIDSLRETANDYLEQGRDKVQEVGESVETHVRDQPMKSILIAAGVGFLLGIFWTRR